MTEPGKNELLAEMEKAILADVKKLNEPKSKVSAMERKRIMDTAIKFASLQSKGKDDGGYGSGFGK